MALIRVHFGSLPGDDPVDARTIPGSTEAADMLGFYDWARFHFMRWRHPPRPMTGLWATLTTEERKRILENKADV